MAIPTLDTHEFTRRADVATGTAPLAALERLGSMLSDTDGALAWSLSGRSELGPDGSRSAFLKLGLDGTVRMRCVRCLEPLELPLRVERDYRLAATEQQAEREDADDDAFDLLVSSRRFDLAALVEDEAIMALPAAPRHGDCSAPGARSGPEAACGQDAEARAEGAPEPRNPFAALAALRGGGDAGAVGGPGVTAGDPDPKRAGDSVSAGRRRRGRG
jgi:uncharacterized protein